MSKRKRRKPLEGFAGLSECHAGAVTVFTDPVSGLKFKGGGLHHDLVVSSELVITAVSDPNTVTLNGIAPDGLEQYLNPVVSLSWDDGMGFAFDRKFWQALLAKIRKQDRDVLCMCFGGHGRTGTMLAIFAALTGAAKGDPVQFVRNHYCQEAVETHTQIKYVEEVTGRKVAVEESRQPKPITGFGSLSDWRDWMDFGRHEVRDDDKLPGWSEVSDPNNKKGE